MREWPTVHNPFRATPLLRVMFLIALVLALHQIVMATPVRARIMPMLSASPMAHATADVAPMRGLCEHCPISTATICPAVQAAFPLAIAALAPLIAGLVCRLLAAAAAAPRTFVPAVWHPPPKRSLVFLQVWRC